jgi:hypothetical protein
MGKAFKFRRLGKDIADVVASSPSQSEAARRLGVDRSTLHRWQKAGKVAPPAGRPKRTETAHATTGEGETATPEQWAAKVREEYAFNETESVLVDMAVMAMRLSQDATLTPSERLSAVGRYQQLLKQLDLEVSGEEEKTPDVRGGWPRRVG